MVLDALLYCNFVELIEKYVDLISKSFAQLFNDVRNCVDLCHRDGAIKDTVMKDPSKYIIYDEFTVPMLQRLRNGGKKVFLLTNSMYEYTNTVMNYLVQGGE